ncbi:hypothetical protein TIFTF001_013375 [Ficus carica]|uniref:Uncharacterized protein n=1 Tax=Ficus carica TaxID=3494 RepID=A0AA88A3E7_FICCA|nr:hypothetical protein TIFTF001_013375 [Ficus carica]
MRGRKRAGIQPKRESVAERVAGRGLDDGNVRKSDSKDRQQQQAKVKNFPQGEVEVFHRRRWQRPEVRLQGRVAAVREGEAYHR